jgi:hypothetical protein
MEPTKEVKMSLRARVLAIALLAGVVAVSSALAESKNAGSSAAIPTPGAGPCCQVAAVDYFIAPALTDANYQRRSR